MPIESQLNRYIGGNLVVVRDTVNQERYEVYLLRVRPTTITERSESILAIMEPLNGRAVGRVDLVPNTTTTVWRCWVDQIATPRWEAMGHPILESVGNISMLEESGALACDVVDAYRIMVLGWNVPWQDSLEVVEPTVKRVSRYERAPVI